MRNFKNYDTLEIIEEWAATECLISSEEELSERFDTEILPSVIKAYGEDDQDAIDQAFNNWSDMLCKDGQIHELQYNSYTYVGEAS
jgi:hypothetical protein